MAKSKRAPLMSSVFVCVCVCRACACVCVCVCVCVCECDTVCHEAMPPVCMLLAHLYARFVLHQDTLNCKIQGEHKVFPLLQTFITRKLRGIKTYFFFQNVTQLKKFF